MNETIKKITSKYLMDFKGINGIDYKYCTPAQLKRMLIEICEEQKKEDASKYEYPYKQWILNSKNIAK